MKEDIFRYFRLVGGTNLSLRFGHRKSIDIDLFTDAEYGSLDFELLEIYLKKEFKYYDCPDPSNIIGFGRSYYIGESENDCIKLDLMYTDPFINEVELVDNIRFASLEDIMAMKTHAIETGGRKKDFWDLHLLMQKYNWDYILSQYEKRHPWTYNKKEIIHKLQDFSSVDDDFNPICLLNKNWDDIKSDIKKAISQIK